MPRKNYYKFYRNLSKKEVIFRFTAIYEEAVLPMLFTRREVEELLERLKEKGLYSETYEIMKEAINKAYLPPKRWF